jgi:hypothetical protein
MRHKKEKDIRYCPICNKDGFLPFGHRPECVMNIPIGKEHEKERDDWQMGYNDRKRACACEGKPAPKQLNNRSYMKGWLCADNRIKSWKADECPNKEWRKP